MVLKRLLVLALCSTATAQEHWSLTPLKSPAVPASREGGLNEIDAFVRERLATAGLKPAAPADRRTLIRRLTYDLHGLPPTPIETAAFVADQSPQAYDRLVSRLLASPRYGERWARHWLDIAHFAETHGHDQDAIRPNAWPYRDWLIRSLNDDKPYGDFVREQIAADVLAPNDPTAVAALGFLAAGPWDESSHKDIRDDTVDKKVAQYLDRDDMLTTVFTAVASSTVHCARCHDHKFDPIPQKDYYAVQAIFAGVERANRPYDPDPVIARLRHSVSARREALLYDKFDVDAEAATVAAWEKQVADLRSPWKSVTATATANASQVEPQDDGSVRFGGPRPERDTYTFALTADHPVTSLRLETLVDPSLPQGGPGRQDNGNFHLSEVRVRLKDARGPIVPLASATADFDQLGWDAAKAIDGNALSAWGIHPQVGKQHEAVFVLRALIPAKTPFVIELDQHHGGGHLIGRVRWSASESAARPVFLPIPREVAVVMAVAPAKRTDDQKRTLTRHVMRDTVERDARTLPPPQAVYAAASEFETLGSFKAPNGPRPVHLLKRGEITKPGELATPGIVPSLGGSATFVLGDVRKEGERRAALARWLTDSGNGLVWRSIVNRVWHHHFGRGIVTTPNDFGVMGAKPSHPELLDWLACWFRDRGGSLKELHRLIVTSATYQQASTHDPEASRIDADNALLWRMNRTRLDAESVKDAMLAVSGKLDPKMGGPSVRNFSTSPGIHVTPVVNYDAFDLDGPGARRRSVYRFVFRTLPDPFLEALDCPDASQFAPVRAASVTPLQALALLNDRFAVRYAEHLAARLTAEESDPAKRIARGIELTFGRPATDAETTRLADYAAKHGLPNACRLLFNANEFLFVD